jgi:hypothetical protein
MSTVARSITSTADNLLTSSRLTRLARVTTGPTRADVDALVGPATPHFAYQLRARLEELVADMPADDGVRRYAEQKMQLLDRLGHASSKAESGPHEAASRPGWDRIPSSAPADTPLPRSSERS